MGKHKNVTQIAILINFMEQHSDIAKGFTKRDKPLVESLWQELTASLNAAGPPSKDVVGWKKVWTEWKSDVKKKLAHNKVEVRATGGGPFSKHHLNKTEETIVRVCGISQAVEGIPGVSIGLNEDALEETDDDMPSTSSKRKTETPYNTPKRAKQENIAQRLSTFLDSDNDQKEKTNKKLEELISIEKENASSMRRIYRAVEKSSETISKAVTELKDDFEIFGARMLTAMQEKNQIKREQLDLELLKFEFEKQKRNNS